MPLIEDLTASFIVRIWRETGGNPSTVNEWRGSIEHVPSGRRIFFRELGAIVTFMKPHLQELGIDNDSHFWEVMSADAADPPLEPGSSDSSKLSTPPTIQPARRRG
jgi:hypothetical protein